ncbi:hypothetical protein [uncultured Kocuria sp.]|uniref:hypothetical protein n=1 Tax=uncultured Kocuria sp. TaxID=259305 RepID=UPI00260258D5|nr:hypothetical protein [uncultured Kocuria sp.]
MNDILSSGVSTAILVVTALLLLALIVLLVRWLAARNGEDSDTETSPCPACPGNLVDCSHCGGQWRERQCVECRLGQTCTHCNLSWAYYLKNERTA